MSVFADILETAIYTGVGFAKRKEDEKNRAAAIQQQENIIKSEQIRKAAELQAKLENQKQIAKIRSSASASSTKNKIPQKDYFGNTAKYEIDAQERLKKMDPMSLANPNHKLIISLEAIRLNPEVTEATKNTAAAAINKLKNNENAAEELNLIRTKYQQLPEIVKPQQSTGSNTKKKSGFFEGIKSFWSGKK